MEGPPLVIVSGLPGTGKTRIAEGLGRRTGLPVFSVAWLLGALSPWGVLERPDRGRLAYALIGAQIEQQLRSGGGAIVDGMVGSAELRARWRGLAERFRALFVVIECVCSDAKLHRRRLDEREESIPGWPSPDWDHAQEMRGRYAPWRGPRLVLDSVRPFAENLAAATRYLEMELGAPSKRGGLGLGQLRGAFLGQLPSAL